MSYTSPVLATFDQRYLDLNLEREAEDTGNFCGMLPEDEEMMMAAPAWETAMEIIPRDRWPDLIGQIDASPDGWTERRIRKIKAQGREGSCVYNAAGLSFEVVWNLLFGDYLWIETSPMSGYRHNARSAGSGSNVFGACVWLRDHGLLPARTEVNEELVRAGLFKHTHPATGWSNKFQTGYETTMDDFRVHEWLRHTSVESWVTALLKGLPCVGGRDMHCIMHCRPLLDGRRLFSMYANSWGTNWGSEMQISGGKSRGFGLDSEAKIATMVRRGAWSPVTVKRPVWLERLKELRRAA